MNKVVTMETEGVTQDKNGEYGIWRTIKRVGKIFIHVGETGEQAVARYTRELLAMPTKKLKKKAQTTELITAQERKILRKEVLRKNVSQKGKVKPVNYAFTANYFYVYTTNGLDNFRVTKKYDIEKNHNTIKELLEERDKDGFK